MSQENETLKLRFKLKTGEEFEAQGDLTFISSQKEAFLNLVKPAKNQSAQGQTLPKQEVLSKENISPKTISQEQPYNKQISWPAPAKISEGEQNFNFKTPSSEVWDKVAYFDGENIIIRRKSKLIKPQIAALIILGAAKVLTGQDNLSALILSKSLKLSGYQKPGQRLDRLLESEVKEGHLSYEGSKRNRLYRISAAGQARAYTWAEKLLSSH